MGALVAPAHAEGEPPILLHYIGDVIGDVDGGRERGADWVSRFDITLSSSDRLLGIDGAHAQVDLMLVRGGGFSADRVGDFQVVSNIDAPHAIRPFEAWVEMPLGARGRAKTGLIDLNSEFDEQNVGALFLNSSFGTGADLAQTGPDGPSIFSVTSPGMVLAYQPPGWVAKIGLFDVRAGDPDRPHRFFPDTIGHDGALLIAETRRQIGPALAIQIGGWSYTQAMPRLDGTGAGTDAGAYALVDARLWARDEKHALRGWVRLGGATAKVNTIGFYLGGGVTWGSETASCGIAVAHARQGDPAYRLAGDEAASYRAETAIEATARWRVGHGLSVQPDLQYVVHPGWDRQAPHALVAALRFDWTGLIPR